MCSTGKVLALDYGERRIGLALSDECKIIASPYSTIDTRIEKHPIQYIKGIIEKENINTLVVGYPLHTNGSVSEKALDVDNFIAEIKKEIDNIKIQKMDERYSSVDAQQIIKNKKTKKRSFKENKNKIDRFAAAIILQDFLNNKNSIS